MRKYIVSFYDSTHYNWHHSSINDVAGDEKATGNIINKEVPTRDYLVNLVSKFIFQRFRKGIDQIEQLTSIKEHFRFTEDDTNQYDISDKTFINDFLSWDNEEKNHMIYELIAKAYDFYSMQCTEEIKFDFSNFEFILDANILMRLMRVNNEYRYASVHQFVSKAKEIGVKLIVSSFTKNEVERSISYQLSNIQELITRDKRILPPQAMSFGNSKQYNSDLYKLFYEWYCDNKSKIEPVEKYKIVIINKLNKLIEDFTYIDNISYDTCEGNNFSGLVASLKKKTDKSQQQAETDINNILFTLESQKDNEDVYLVSTDWRLIEWSRNTYPSKKSLVDLPSLWLSILMKYTGRVSGDDYSAFCQFIRLPIEPLQIQDLDRKIQLRDEINKSEYADEIKNRMLIDLNNNYSAYLKLNNDEAKQKVLEKVLKDEHDSGFKEAEGKFSVETEQLKLNKEKEIQDLNNIIKEKDAELEKIQKEKEESDKKSVGYRKEQWIKKKVEEKSKVGDYLKDHINRIYLIAAIVTAILMVIILLYFNYIKKMPINDLADWIGLCFGLIPGGIVLLVVKALIEITDRDILEKKYRKKADKKFDL